MTKNGTSNDKEGWGWGGHTKEGVKRVNLVWSLPVPFKTCMLRELKSSIHACAGVAEAPGVCVCVCVPALSALQT